MKLARGRKKSGWEVHGERDSPAQVTSFLERYSDDFIGVNGQPDEVRKIASNFSASFFKESPDHGGKCDITHSPQMFVLDQKGRLRAELYNAPLESMVGTANALIEEGS